MISIVVFGVGKIGMTVVELLAQSGDYSVLAVDRDPKVLASVAKLTNVTTQVIDVEEAHIHSCLEGKFAALSSLPHHLTIGIAAAAKTANVHYLDLTEDVRSTSAVKVIAEGSTRAFIPQCGLAPGAIAIVAYHLSKKFEKIRSLKLFVGALPLYPVNAFKYNLTWSVEGLINEYCEPCDSIVNGYRQQIPPLENLERIVVEGEQLEAFNTSGGLGTLCETLEGKVEELSYRTLRYPGHASLMKTLLFDLGLRNKRALLKQVFEASIPQTSQDIVYLFVTVIGHRNNALEQESWSHKICGDLLDGNVRSAIQLSTATSVCCIIDLLATGQIKKCGLVRQEDIDWNVFTGNRFGMLYQTGLCSSRFKGGGRKNSQAEPEDKSAKYSKINRAWQVKDGSPVN